MNNQIIPVRIAIIIATIGFVFVIAGVLKI